MHQMARRVVFVLGLVSGLGVAAVWGQAQGNVASRAVGHVVVSGSDVGFRIEARKGSTPVGRMVIRENGEWIEVESPAGIRPALIK